MASDKNIFIRTEEYNDEITRNRTLEMIHNKDKLDAILEDVSNKLISKDFLYNTSFDDLLCSSIVNLKISDIYDKYLLKGICIKLKETGYILESLNPIIIAKEKES